MERKIHIKPITILLCVGIILRASHYLDNLSLWGDEAWVALSLIQGSIQDILHGMSFGNFPIPPVGFLLSIKLLCEGFGYSEYILRLFPFLCGILSLWLYTKFLKDHFETITQYVACALFVFSDPVIYYSAQLKQYSSDVAITVLLYSMCLRMLKNPLSLFQMIVLASIGFFSICLSYSSIFILSGIAIGHVFMLCLDKSKARNARPIIVFLSWLLGFLFIYFLYYCTLFESKAIGYQEKHFLSSKNFSTVIVYILDLFKNPLCMSFHRLGFPIFILGVYSLFKRNRRIVLQLALPILLTIVASFLNKYPFHERFLLFLLPVLFIFMAEGFAFIYKKGNLGKLMSVALLGIFFIQPVVKTSKHVIEPRYYSETRDLIRSLKEKQAQKDGMYLNNEAQYAFRYYAHYFKYPYTPRIIGITNDGLGTDDSGEYIFLYHNEKGFDSRVYTERKLVPGKINPQGHSLTELEGRGRVWILFSQINTDAEEHFLKCLDERGTLMVAEKGIGASLYLYDLN